MTRSPQIITGTLGALALMAATLVSGVVRQDDWSVVMESGVWVTAMLVTAFMGLWGFITLIISSANTNDGAKKGLLGLAALYFLAAVILTVDIIINGNSTAGIAFFLLPGVATVIMLPAIAIIAWLGWKIDEARID